MLRQDERQSRVASARLWRGDRGGADGRLDLPRPAVATDRVNIRRGAARVHHRFPTRQCRTRAADRARLPVRGVRVRNQFQRRRGLKQNGPVRGEKAKIYVDISRLLDEAMDHFDQIPSGRPNGFHLGPKAAWKGNQPSRRVFRPELFAIWTPRRRWN